MTGVEPEPAFSSAISWLPEGPLMADLGPPTLVQGSHCAGRRYRGVMSAPEPAGRAAGAELFLVGPPGE